MKSTSSSSSDASHTLHPDIFKLQIIAFDSYQVKPTVLDKSHATISVARSDNISTSHKPFLQVPVIRIFGKVPTGHSILLNVHNCFPYIFIEYDGDLRPDYAKEHLTKLKLEIEKQLFLSFKRLKLRKSKEAGLNEDEDIPDIFNDYSNDENDTANYENKYVCSLDLVKSVPFYGYHVGYKAFVKISILNPRYVTRLCSILLQKKVRGKAYQPYEAHIPHMLQFLADYNLYGSDWLYLKNVLWRSPIISGMQLEKLHDDDFEYTEEEMAVFSQMRITDSLKQFISKHAGVLPEEAVFGNMQDYSNVIGEEQFPRVGSAVLEIDCLPQWIVNRSSAVKRELHHEFLELMRPAEFAHHESYIESTKDILRDVQHQRKLRNLDRESFFSKLSLMYSGDIRSHDGGTRWIEQDELEDMLKHCINLSKDLYRGAKPPQLETFVQNSSFFNDIATPNEKIDCNIFYIGQWSKVPLLKAAAVKLESKSNFLESGTSDKNDGVLPSSMFEDMPTITDGSRHQDALEMQPDEGEYDQEDWLGTVAPHMSQDFENDVSIETDPDLDKSDADFLHEARPGMKAQSSGAAPGQSITSRGDLAAGDQFLFSQIVRQEKALPLSSPVVRSAQALKASLLEFQGSRGLPKNDHLFGKSMEEHGALQIEYLDPFYSIVSDKPAVPFIFAAKRFDLFSNHYSDLRLAVVNGNTASYAFSEALKAKKSRGGCFEYRFPLPSSSEVSKWSNEDRKISKSQLFKSQIIPHTPSLKNGFKYPSPRNEYKRKKTDFNKMMTFAIEIHVNTRGVLKPDPEKDAIAAIFWTFDKNNYPFEFNLSESGILVLDEDDSTSRYNGLSDYPVAVFNNEVMMIRELVSIVKLVDPDLLCGYEIHAQSWGFMIERFRKVYDIDLCSKLSRANFKSNDKFGDRWGYTHASGIKITGRHMVNLWRILRSEVNLLRYSIQNVAFHVLHRRVPHYSEQQLSSWFESKTPNKIAIVWKHYLTRIKLNMDLLDSLEIISKTTEQARLIGVDFYSVFYRGSQFKVESFLIRLTKAENFMLISPSKQQVFKSDALQCIPLIMEPPSAFYKSPLVVLDFQSLYPSVIIAYNYCYSTILGRLRGYNPKVPQTIGVTQNRLKPGLLELLQDHINISPNGLMFMKSEVRKSLLAKMLTEILETRIAVKETMKNIDDYELNRLYNSRQLALKLLANVTYGYTSATFSGRMPCADIADSIVSTARETLRAAISEIEKNEKWGAKVIYGDTDSLFVYLPGKSKDEAFKLGEEMASHITSINPKPIKLKFEKVYHPSVLITKKRYVGYSYTYPSQTKPSFDAKGIETVRRDGIPAQQKMLEKTLRTLFETCDLSQVKSYVQNEFSKIQSNKVSLQDFCFAKEVRMGTYKDERYAPAGAHVTKKLMEADERAEPQYKERVPYVVVQSRRGERLRDRCVTPRYFLDNEVTMNLRLDFEYYITKALIPPLERVFNLMGVDIKAWYRHMPRISNYGQTYESHEGRKRAKLGGTLHPFFKVWTCLSCARATGTGKKLCPDCMKDELGTFSKLQAKLKSQQNEVKNILAICRSCSTVNHSSDISDPIEAADSCISDDCPVFYSRLKAKRKLDTVSVRQGQFLEETNSW